MKLTIVHGRTNPDVDMEQWGFPGPVLKGVKQLHWTYGTITVEFYSEADLGAAQQLTAWDTGVYQNSLVMRMEEDMVKTWNGVALRNEWFGDWWLEE